MYPCLPTKCGLVFCPHLRYLTISSFSRREALTCANQPFCSLGRIWSLITPDCSRSHGYLKSPASLFLREPHGMFLASIDLYHCSLSLSLACVGPSFHTQASGIFSLLESLDSCLLGGCCTQRRFIVYCKARPCIAPSVPYRDLNEVELLFICFINIKLLEFELNSARITG